MKICIFDIDGVLNDYPDCYVDFVNKKLDKNFKNLSEIKSTLTYREYKEIKYIYRTCGYKENLEVKKYSKEVLKELKRMGYYIIILSSRPVDEINSLIIQTTNWLKKNDLEYDYLMFGNSKHLDVIQKFGNVEFIVEDNRSFANNIARHNYKVFLLKNDYNVGKLHDNVKPINHIYDILEDIRG